MSRLKFFLGIGVGCALCWWIGTPLSDAAISLVTLGIFTFTGLLCAAFIALDEPIDRPATIAQTGLMVRSGAVATQPRPLKVWVVDQPTQPRLEVSR